MIIMYAIVLSFVLSLSFVNSHNLPMCSPGYYRCSGFDPMIAKYVYSKCIREDLICNGQKDCYYNEDEEDCFPTTTPVFVVNTTDISTNRVTHIDTLSTTLNPSTINSETTAEPTTILAVTTKDNSLSTPSSDLSTSDFPFTSDDSSTTQTIDTTSNEDKSHDYFELMVAILISFSTVVVLVSCVVIHNHLVKKKKRRELSVSHQVRTTNSNYGNKLV